MGVQFEGHSGRVRTMSVSVDGQYLVTGSDDNTVRLWEVRQRRLQVAYYHALDRGLDCASIFVEP